MICIKKIRAEKEGLEAQSFYSHDLLITLKKQFVMKNDQTKKRKKKKKQ